MLQVVKQAQDGIPSAVTRAVVDELVARRIEQYPRISSNSPGNASPTSWR
jgi:hypothetical protein